MLSWEKRFWSNVGKTSECWLWKGCCNNKGYGSLSVNGTTRLAHRLAWILEKKLSIPEGMLVLHSCDVRHCVRPAHLFLGTYKDNMQDMIIKYRSDWSRPCHGEKVGGSKLTEKDIYEIREMEGKLSQKEVAQIYGVDRSNISCIWLRKTWRHI